MSNNIQKNSRGVSQRASRNYRIERVYIGDRTAEDVIADLVKTHAQVV